MYASAGSQGFAFTGDMFNGNRLLASSSGMQTDEDLNILKALRVCSSLTAKALGDGQQNILCISDHCEKCVLCKSIRNERKNFLNLYIYIQPKWPYATT